MRLTDKLARLYMYDQRSSFGKEGAVKTVMKEWRDAIAIPGPPGLQPLTESQSCLVDHFRILLHRGQIISVPPRAAAEGDDDWVTTADIIINLQAVSLTPLKIEDLAGALANDGWRFYEVIHANPGGRTTTQARRTPTSCISVREFRFGGISAEGFVMVEPIADALSFFDLKQWSDKGGFQHALHKVILWRAAPVSTHLACIPEQGGSALAIAHDDDDPLLALVPVDAGQDALAHMAGMAAGFGEGLMPLALFDSHPIVPRASVDALVRNNALQISVDEFSEDVVSINWRQVVWRSRRGLFDPKLIGSAEADVQSLGKMSKVALCSALLRMGWEALPRPATLKDVNTKELCHRNLFRSKSYWIALHHARDIFVGKGVAEIPHDMPHAFYDCLCSLRQASLHSMLAHPDFAKFKNEHFLKFLKGDGVTSLSDVPSLADEELADLFEDLDEDEVADMHAPLALPMVPRVAARSRFFGDVKVYFDNCSHQSGQRRAYIKCGNADHHAEQFCVRYTFLHKHTSEVDCCAWLLAWRHDGHHCESREHHKYFSF